MAVLRHMSKKVIIVDDSLVARKMVVNVLSKVGFVVVEAMDGQDGLDKIKANSDAAVIICDVNMPRMSGLDLLASLQADVVLAKVPFLMLTTEGRPEVVAEAKKNGARGWLMKPLQPEMLLAVVNKIAA
jgi:two-component system chemotaxis response regulator CheY